MIATEVELLEAGRVEAGEQHVVDEQQVDLAVLVSLDLLFAENLSPSSWRINAALSGCLR